MTNLWEHIDLCSGIGGFSLGFQWAKLSEPILFCELDEFCQKILKKHWPDVPICNDVKELADDTTKFIPRPRGRKRILTAGYPCQPFSQAGQRRGSEDPRHIWPYILRIIQQERPDVCVFENVSGHISLGLDEVLHDLEGESYTTRAFVLPAEACGASHRRDRLWIIARNMGNAKIIPCNEPKNNSEASTKRERKLRRTGSTEDVPNTNSEGLQGSKETRNIGEGRSNSNQFSTRHGGTSDVPNTNSQRGCSWQTGNKDAEDVGQSSRGKEQGGRNTQRGLGGMVDGLSKWLDEPVDIPRVASGQKNRTHRLKALGNAIVPQIAQRIGIAIKESF